MSLHWLSGTHMKERTIVEEGSPWTKFVPLAIALSAEAQWWDGLFPNEKIRKNESHILISKVPWENKRRDTKVACGASTPIYLLWYWFLWFLACSIRKICCEEKWSIVHLHGKQSSTYRGSRFPPTDSFKHWEDSSVEERGPVQEIHCNRGTNFTSAETELNRAIEEMDDKKIKADFLKANIA